MMQQNRETDKQAKAPFGVLEAIVTLMIILVIVQTFLEDLAVVAGWSEGIRQFLNYSGFFFDFFFTVEFLVRFSLALDKGRGIHYLTKERGWIDLMASVPLLIFNSAPLILAPLLGGIFKGGVGGTFNMLKLVKAIRIARVLRLLRLLKVFKKIKYTDSVMAQRHITRIITLGVTTLVFTLFIVNTFVDLADLSGVKKARLDQVSRVFSLLEEEPNRSEVIKSLRTLESIHSILLIKEKNRVLYTRYDDSYYATQFTEADYEEYNSLDMDLFVFFDLREENVLREKSQAKDSLIFFFLVIVIVLVYLVLYSPHFALTVTDPIFVMRRGMEDPHYNLNVKIPGDYENDDVYQLSSLYNDEYLPLKDRNRDEEAGAPGLEMEDFKDIFDSGEDF